MTPLPPLPRVLNKREAKITPMVNAWMLANGPDCCAWEIKATSKNTIPKSAVMPHQLAALKDATGNGIVHKLSDEARRKQPFDAFKLARADAYVVACFTKTRRCFVIGVFDWEGIASASPPKNAIAFSY